MQETKNNKFRDSLSTVDDNGERVWVYPKKPKGKLFNHRAIVAFFLVSFLVAAPFIKLNGLPLILLNVVERKFVIFGAIFWPQDFFIFAVGFIASIVFLALFTVIYGRIFCGWVCPQTIFMEFIFRRVEYLIEGDYTAQKKLNRQDWNSEKIIKKTIKHFAFFSIAFLTANLLLAYIIGVDALHEIITDDPKNHTGGLIAILVFSGVFYWIFAFFREQVCTIACPYGRLQGTLLDKDSVVVAYDYERGEPRGKLRKNKERTLGDCIDCKQCVHVCPTGIDIRNGTQLECINCTACIDECDSIMDRIGKPKNLIGYISEKNIKKRSKFKLSARAYAYSTVLVLLIGLVVGLLATRDQLAFTILRAKGITYQKAENGDFINLFEVKMLNKSMEDLNVTAKIENTVVGQIDFVGNGFHIPPEGRQKGLLKIQLPEDQLEGTKTKLVIGVYGEDGELITKAKTEFLGPFNLDFK